VLCDTCGDEAVSQINGVATCVAHFAATLHAVVLIEVVEKGVPDDVAEHAIEWADREVTRLMLEDDEP
jgi:hypothetical protein